METSIDQKRRELFEIHKVKLGTDAPLMRQAGSVTVPRRKIVSEKGPASSKVKFVVIGATGTIALIMAIFFAKEAGWLN